MTTAHGAARRKAARSGYDYYRTPVECIESLIAHAQLYPEGTIDQRSASALDPCCGSGTISRALQRAGWVTHSWDIRPQAEVYGRGNVDFLASTPGADFVDLIVCNPPYNISKDFIAHALKFKPRAAFFLMRLTWMASSRRKEWLKESCLRKVYVLTKRPKMWDARKPEPNNGGMVDYAWFCFQPGQPGPTEVEWI